MSQAGLHLGAVTAFDEVRGLGEVTTGGDEAWSFHCTAISDGSRRIEVGAHVVFRVVPGHMGRMEARDVTALDARAWPTSLGLV